tara:strand:- start:1110 stop:2591 length:1482 start_codon:yes stop_codon:yes gene_type:complete
VDLRVEQTALQDKVIADLRAVLRTDVKRAVIQGPTGFGKTAIAKAITKGGREKGSNVVFTVPLISLINQTARSFWDDGLREFGIMQASHEMTDPTQPIQICSIDTLSRRGERPLADFVIVDECHRNNEWLWKWMQDWKNTIFIGMSATPWTKGLGNHYQALVKGPTTEELISLGMLSDFKVYAPDHPDLTGVRKTSGDYGPDYNQIDLAEAMNKDPLVANIVDTWMQRAEMRPTIAYCVDRAHAAKVQAQFIAAGVPWSYIDAYTDIDERDQIKAQLDTRQIYGVANVGCLTMGIDWDVRCIILAVPIRSEMKFVQIIGRGLRTAPGKDYCLILDHSDSHQRLGFVTDIDHYQLDNGTGNVSSSKDTPDPKEPKECPACGHLKPTGVHVCPECGFAPQKQSDIDPVEGELAELKRSKLTKTQLQSREVREQTYAMALWHAMETGKKTGWAWYLTKDRCGGAPKNRNVEPIEPDQEMRNYIKYKAIRYAKSRQI